MDGWIGLYLCRRWLFGFGYASEVFIMNAMNSSQILSCSFTESILTFTPQLTNTSLQPILVVEHAKWL